MDLTATTITTGDMDATGFTVIIECITCHFTGSTTIHVTTYSKTIVEPALRAEPEEVGDFSRKPAGLRRLGGCSSLFADGQEAKKMAARVNEQMCIECGKCVKKCPVNAITLLATEIGLSNGKDPQARPDGTVHTHAHARRRHESGLIGRFWGRGHVHRGR